MLSFERNKWRAGQLRCLNIHMMSPVLDFYAGPSARGRQLYCRACNFENVSALLAGNFYTCYVEPNDLPLLMNTGTTRFYSKDIHLVMIQTNTSQKWMKSRDVKIVLASPIKGIKVLPWPFCQSVPALEWRCVTWVFPNTWLQQIRIGVNKRLLCNKFL